MERAELAAAVCTPPPAHNVWFAHDPPELHTGFFAESTMVLKSAMADEGHPAPLLFMQVTKVFTTLHTPVPLAPGTAAI